MKKLTNEDLAQVVNLADEMQRKYNEWRKGQCFFNALYELFPDVADEVRGTIVDPFHIDGRIKICTELITESTL